VYWWKENGEGGVQYHKVKRRLNQGLPFGGCFGGKGDAGGGGEERKVGNSRKCVPERRGYLRSLRKGA